VIVLQRQEGQVGCCRREGEKPNVGGFYSAGCVNKPPLRVNGGENGRRELENEARNQLKIGNDHRRAR
jgi:hypothetical protein